MKAVFASPSKTRVVISYLNGKVRNPKGSIFAKWKLVDTKTQESPNHIFVHKYYTVER